MTTSQVSDWATAFASMFTTKLAAGSITYTQISNWATGLAAATFGTSQITGLAASVTSQITTALGGVTTLAAASIAGSAITGSIAASLISGITTTEQSIIDSLNAGLGLPSGGPPTSLQAALAMIPATNISGQWTGNIQTDVQKILTDATVNVGALATTGGLGGALAGIATLLGYTPSGTSTPGSITDITQNNNLFISNASVTKQIAGCMDTSCDAPFDLSNIMSGASPTTCNVTATSSLISFMNTPHGGIKQSVSWLGSGTANINGMYVNVYQLNIANAAVYPNNAGNLPFPAAAVGALVPVYTSPNIMDTQAVSNGLAWNYWNFPSSAIPTAQGNCYATEIAVTGSGTYAVAGVPTSWVLSHPTALPSRWGATRTLPGGVTPSVDYVGAGGNIHSQATNVVSTTAAHTGAAGAYLVVDVGAVAISNLLPTITCTYGGTPMTELIGTCAYSVCGWQFGFRIPTNLAGLQTIAVSVTGSGVSNISSITIGSTSYLNVGYATVITPLVAPGGALGPAPWAAYGSISPVSQANIPIATAGWIHQSFMMVNTSGAQTVSAYTGGTQHWLRSSVAINDVAMITGYGAAAVTFGATQSVSGPWVGLGVILTPVGTIANDPLLVNGGGSLVTGNVTTGALTRTYTSTVTAGGCAIVDVAAGTNIGLGGVATITATYGGVAMTQTGLQKFNGSTSGAIAQFQLKGPTLLGGPQTVSVTVTPTSSYVSSIVANTRAYLGVGIVGTPVAAYGTGTSLSTLATVNPQGGMVLCAFGATAASVSMLGPAASVAWVTNNFHMSSGSTDVEQLTGYSVDTTQATTPFAVTASFTGPWGSLTTILTPVPQATTTNPVYSTNTAWMGLNGLAGQSQYAPDLQTFIASGTYHIPTWANHLDIIVCGGGASGRGGATFGGLAGAAGQWNQVTLNKAQWTGSTIAITIGAGGAYNAAAAGGNTTAVVGTWGTLTGNGGPGGQGYSGSSVYGQPGGGPGNDQWPVSTGTVYPGGAGGGSPQSGGWQPGGSGAGGNATFYPGTYIYGGPGGAGIAYINAYQ